MVTLVDTGVFEVMVPGQPRPQGSKRAVGRGRMIEASKHVSAWRQLVHTHAEAVMSRAGSGPLDGPLTVEMVFTLPRPTSRPAWWPEGQRWGKRVHARPAGYPDIVKLARAVEDALTTAGVWADDSRVVGYGKLSKHYPGDAFEPDVLDHPGVVVRVWRLGDA